VSWRRVFGQVTRRPGPRQRAGNHPRDTEGWKKERKKKGTGEDLGRKEGRENVRKKTDNPREGWEEGRKKKERKKTDTPRILGRERERDF